MILSGSAIPSLHREKMVEKVQRHRDRKRQRHVGRQEDIDIDGPMVLANWVDLIWPKRVLQPQVMDQTFWPHINKSIIRAVDVNLVALNPIAVKIYVQPIIAEE